MRNDKKLIVIGTVWTGYEVQQHSTSTSLCLYGYSPSKVLLGMVILYSRIHSNSFKSVCYLSKPKIRQAYPI